MSVSLGSITTGLGNLTPEVWNALGETVQKVRDLEQRFQRAQTLATNPPLFLAKITGYERVSAISSSGPVEGQIPNPKNVYLYTFEEVILKFKPGLSVENEDDASIVELVTPKTFQGKRTNETLGVKAVNLAEFGQPTTRSLSFGGVMLDANQYPQVSTVPTIHGSNNTNQAGNIEPTGTGTGPIVVMYLVEGQDAEQFKFEDGEKVDPPEVEENEGYKPIIPVFYSAINLDGACQ